MFLQGGTAIRWCHNGSRFSEDLDFVIHGDAKFTDAVMNKIFQQLRREVIAHLGLGTLDIVFKKSSRAYSHVYYCDFVPDRERGKISVKVEFEELIEDLSPHTDRMILSMLPPVRRLIAAGEFRIPTPSSIILVETMEEILSDKIRALLERRYLKGRDFYDVWFLNSLGITCTEENIKRKLTMYKTAFVQHRQIDFFLKPNKEERREIVEAVKQDLSRFLPPNEMAFFEGTDFDAVFDSLRIVLLPLRVMGKNDEGKVR
ncbi:MAG: nucleotidyl transferase AbiEii/AbiGii toxin family protein [bacterium]